MKSASPANLLVDACESLATFRQLGVHLAGQLAESLGNLLRMYATEVGEL